MKEPVNTEQFAIGEPIAWDLYDGSGNRIFTKGFIIHSESNLNRIRSMTLYRDAGEESSLRQSVKDQVKSAPAQVGTAAEYITCSLVEYMDMCFGLTENLLSEISSGAKDQQNSIQMVISNIFEIHKIAENILTCLAHFWYEHAISSYQPIYSAALSLLAVKQLDLDDQVARSLVGAALTANIGMYQSFDVLVNSKGELSAEEKRILREHPSESAKLLEQNGIQDELWLRIVREHHERRDGSGYPNQLKGSQIARESIVLGIIDTYLAMITPRAYRPSLTPRVALENIHKSFASDLDLVKKVIEAPLGIYPPGTLVSLINDEIGMVSEKINGRYMVAAMGKKGGHKYPESILRDTSLSPYKIRAEWIVKDIRGRGLIPVVDKQKEYRFRLFRPNKA